MAARKDYYATLGVTRDADADEIKTAYRKLARKWHPDVNAGNAEAEDRFKEISEAYHVLGDSQQREQYDRVGPEVFAQNFDLPDFADQFGHFFRSGFSPGAPGRERTADFDMFDDILSGLGGAGLGGAPRPPPQRAAGRDIRLPLQLAFGDAVRGIDRTVAYRHLGGTQRTRVRIPAGVKDGATIRVTGEGEPSPNGGPTGDLLLDVAVVPHPHLQCVGNDLRTDVAITMYEAVLGGKVRVPTLDGTSTINLPQGTRGGQVFRLRGKGVVTEDGTTGDLLARVVIHGPGTVDDDLLALMEKFRSEHPYDPRTED